MATIINNPDTGSSNSGMGTVVGIVLAIIIVALFFMYGLPAMRGTQKSGTTVNVPEKVQVDVNQGAGN